MTLIGKSLFATPRVVMDPQGLVLRKASCLMFCNDQLRSTLLEDTSTHDLRIDLLLPYGIFGSEVLTGNESYPISLHRSNT